jgi:hypothetical protein
MSEPVGAARVAQPGAAPIIQFPGWDREEFERDHLYPRTPLCIRSTADDRAPLTRWHPRQLAGRVGHREVPLADGSVIDFSEYVDALLRLDGGTSHAGPTFPT